MSRGLSDPQRLAAALPHRQVAPLVELVFDAGSLYLTTAPFDVPAGANTYISTGPLGAIEPMTEASGSTEGMQFTLSGVDPAMVNIATATDYVGRLVIVRKAYFHFETNQLIGTPVVSWIGRMRTMAISEQSDSASISLTAEHFEAELNRPAPLRYNNADQARLYPGDRGCEYVEGLTERVVVWPSAEALKK